MTHLTDTYRKAVPLDVEKERQVHSGVELTARTGVLAQLYARMPFGTQRQAGDMAWNSVGSFGYLFLHAMGIALIARAAGAESVGIYLLAQAVGMPLSMFCGLRYHDINATEQDISRISGHFRNIAIIALPSTTAALGLWWLFTEGESQLIGINIILANVLQGFAQAPQGRMIRLRQFRIAAVFEMLRGVVSLLSFSVGLLLLNSLVQATVLLLCGWVVLLAVEYRIASRLSNKMHQRDTGTSDVIQQMRYAISDSLGLFQTSSVRLVVGVIMTEAAVGILGATALLIKFIHPISIALAKTVLPDVVEELAREDYRRISQRLAIINIATISCIAVFSLLGYWATPPLIEWLLGAELRPPPAVAAILMVGAAPLIGSRFLTHLLIALRQPRSVETAALVGLICSVIFAIPLTWLFGLPGAAAALAISYCCRYLLEAYYVLRSARNLEK